MCTSEAVSGFRTDFQSAIFSIVKNCQSISIPQELVQEVALVAVRVAGGRVVALEEAARVAVQEGVLRR